MRTLAIDFGEHRIGVAISDAGGSWATPLEVIAVNDARLAIPPIVKIVVAEAVERIVIGLPLNMDGSIGPSARSVIAWANPLKQACEDAQHHLRLIFVDERLSTFDAEQTLLGRKKDGEKLTRKRKQQRLDAIAAAGFLQAFLDGRIAEVQLPAE